MTREQVKKRIEKLKKVIARHRYLSHVLDQQEIPEGALDSLKYELFQLEQQYPEFITPDSPTQRVAGRPLEKFEKVRHPFPMLSFNDAFSEKDMEDWQERNFKLLTKDEISKIDYFCEPKLDGLAIELIYENGFLKIGSTRGDGTVGENVTQNLKTIESIPLKLRDRGGTVPRFVVVRGEAIISKKNFEEVNKEQIKRNLAPFANPRNLAAGSIRQLDPKITAERKLDAAAYDLIGNLGQETHEEEHKILQALGLKTNNKYAKYCRDLAEIFDFHKYWQENREGLPYEIDGVVAIVNDNKIFEKLGVVGKAPRAAIAFKFPLKQATTVVEDIKVQVGRTGAITPVAYLRPVEVSGVTISRATLHNIDEIKRLGVKIGDTVIVGRAGDVIPDIISVLPELRIGKEKEFLFPEKCPACGNKLIKPETEVVWRCQNPKCFARQREYFCHFVSKDAFDIAGLGPKIASRLIDEGLVSDPADLFELKEGDILLLERFAEKSAKKLINAIQSKNKITLPRFIYGLGIRNVGEETARDLAEYFSSARGGWGSLEKFKKAPLEEFQKIRDVGPVVARSIFNWFQEKRNQKFLDDLMKAGIKILAPERVDKRLAGKTFVITGTLDTMSRAEAKRRILLEGGRAVASVSKQTDYLVVGKDPGVAKCERAKKLGVKTIFEKEFLGLLKFK